MGWGRANVLWPSRPPAPLPMWGIPRPIAVDGARPRPPEPSRASRPQGRDWPRAFLRRKTDKTCAKARPRETGGLPARPGGAVAARGTLPVGRRCRKGGRATWPQDGSPPPTRAGRFIVAETAFARLVVPASEPPTARALEPGTAPPSPGPGPRFSVARDR